MCEVFSPFINRIFICVKFFLKTYILRKRTKLNRKWNLSSNLISIIVIKYSEKCIGKSFPLYTQTTVTATPRDVQTHPEDIIA